MTTLDEALRALLKEMRSYADLTPEQIAWADRIAALLTTRQEVAPVAGPWEAIAVGGKIVVASEEFGNDVWLYVTGDFDDTDEHLEYADRIARILNSTAHTSEARDALQEILRVHANDDHRPKAFYIAANALAAMRQEAE